MDLQTRKINVIEYIVALKDEYIIQEIEDLIHLSKKNDNKLPQLTESELLNRAKKSSEQYESGEYIEQTELEKDSKSW